MEFSLRAFSTLLHIHFVQAQCQDQFAMFGFPSVSSSSVTDLMTCRQNIACHYADFRQEIRKESQSDACNQHPYKHSMFNREQNYSWQRQNPGANYTADSN